MEVDEWQSFGQRSSRSVRRDEICGEWVVTREQDGKVRMNTENVDSLPAGPGERRVVPVPPGLSRAEQDGEYQRTKRNTESQESFPSRNSTLLRLIHIFFLWILCL